MIKKILYAVIVLSVLLAGCVEIEEITDGDTNLYSREYTEIMTSSDSFGEFKSDDIYVALDYIYNNESIKSLHGDNFDIVHEDIICYKSETQTKFFRSRIKGEADYLIKIDNTSYRIKLTKDYNQKWKVVSCENENR